MATHEQMKKRIMRRVWAIYLIRRATSPIALQTYVMSFFTVQLFVFVSLPHVVANMPSITHPVEFLSFYASSFLNTEPLVQIIAVGFLTSIVWLTRNIVRNLEQGSLAMQRSGA